MARTLRTLLCLPVILGLFTGCRQDPSVVVGAVLPLTGEFAIYGEPIRRGIELGFEELQADPEFPYTLDLQIRDSESDPQKATAQLEELYGAGAPAVIGGVTTAEALAMVAVADRFDRVLLSPSASSPQLTGLSTNFFRVFPSDFEEGTKMGYFATQALDVDEVVIAAAESQYAKGIQQVFEQEIRRNGGEVIDVIEYPPNTADLGGVIDRIVTLSPEAVYLADYARGLETLVSGLAERGYEGHVLTTSSVATPEFVEAVGEAANGVLFTQSSYDVDSDVSHIRQFVEKFRAEYGKVPDLYAAHGYDAMRVYGHALVLGGGRRPSNFWQGMRGTASFPGVTGPIQFDEQGNVQKFPRVYVVRNGVFVDYDRVLGERRQGLEERRRAIQQRMKDLERQRRGLRDTDG